MSLSVNPRQIILHRGVLFVPDYLLGHEEVEWSEEDEPSLQRVKKIFQDKLKAGWAAFKEVVHEDQRKWERVEEFDPKAGRMLLLPLTKSLAGGG